jgi:cytochrome P450
MTRPDRMAELAVDPSLRKSAIEELLRFDGPLLTSTERYAAEAVEFEGAAIPAGATVYAALASANRDEWAFADPDRLDLRRSPNRHLAFGDGMHFCAGAALARLEAQIAIGEFASRFPRARSLNPGALAWKGGIVLRGLKALPVELQP